ncbi:MAG: hypothetical protein WCD53_29810, partial [Microcoleus sp.]
AQSHQAEIDEAVQERMERDRLELERKRLETTAKIEQLKQLQAEDDLRQSLNNVRGDLGLATLDPTEDPMQLQTQLAVLLTSLKDLETQQPDLPDNVKALLAEARGDINLALQGKEAANIQESLLSAMDGMIGQIESYKSEINRIDLEEQWDNQLLQTAQTDLQGASQQFLEELQRAEELSGEKQIIEPLYEEVLNKIALAEQAVEISSDLAQQGKEILDQIIEQRIEQRKFRKKMFWNKILGIISQVAGILSTVLMILSPAFPALIPFSIGLGAVSGAINTIQAVINGDWMGAIFSGIMTGLTAVSGGLGQMASAGAKAAAQTIKTLQTIASGAFAGARSIMSGDSIMGFLQILGSVASAASAGMSSFINQCSGTLKNVMLSVVQSLQQAPQMIYSGIKSIQSGDWLNAIGNFFNGALAIGQSFAGNFNTAVAGILENISKVGNTALYLGNAIKNGGIEGWLSGLNGILGLWKNDLMGMVDKISGKEECECIGKNNENDPEKSSEITSNSDEINEKIRRDFELQSGINIKSATLLKFPNFDNSSSSSGEYLIVETEDGQKYIYEKDNQGNFYRQPEPFGADKMALTGDVSGSIGKPSNIPLIFVANDEVTGGSYINENGQTVYWSEKPTSVNRNQTEAIIRQGNNSVLGKLGSLSETYESGGRGPGTVSTGKGDPGGASYGTYQLSSKTGTLSNFLKAEGSQWLGEFKGLEPGTKAFNDKWQEIAQKEPGEFGDAQHEFIRKTHYEPLASKVAKDLNLDVDQRSKALKDVVWSTSVQHGGSTSVVNKALENQEVSKMSDAEIIKSIYTERGRKNPKTGTLVHFPSSSKDVQKGVANRFINEQKEALNLLEKEQKDSSSQP